MQDKLKMKDATAVASNFNRGKAIVPREQPGQPTESAKRRAREAAGPERPTKMNTAQRVAKKDPTAVLPTWFDGTPRGRDRPSMKDLASSDRAKWCMLLTLSARKHFADGWRLFNDVSFRYTIKTTQTPTFKILDSTVKQKIETEFHPRQFKRMLWQSKNVLIKKVELSGNEISVGSIRYASRDLGLHDIPAALARSIVGYSRKNCGNDEPRVRLLAFGIADTFNEVDARTELATILKKEKPRCMVVQVNGFSSNYENWCIDLLNRSVNGTFWFYREQLPEKMTWAKILRLALEAKGIETEPKPAPAQAEQKAFAVRTKEAAEARVSASPKLLEDAPQPEADPQVEAAAQDGLVEQTSDANNFDTEEVAGSDEDEDRDAQRKMVQNAKHRSKSNFEAEEDLSDAEEDTEELSSEKQGTSETGAVEVAAAIDIDTPMAGVNPGEDQPTQFMLKHAPWMKLPPEEARGGTEYGHFEATDTFKYRQEYRDAYSCALIFDSQVGEEIINRTTERGRYHRAVITQVAPLGMQIAFNNQHDLPEDARLGAPRLREEHVVSVEDKGKISQELAPEDVEMAEQENGDSSEEGPNGFKEDGRVQRDDNDARSMTLVFDSMSEKYQIGDVR